MKYKKKRLKDLRERRLNRVKRMYAKELYSLIFCHWKKILWICINISLIWWILNNSTIYHHDWLKYYEMYKLSRALMQENPIVQTIRKLKLINHLEVFGIQKFIKTCNMCNMHYLCINVFASSVFWLHFELGTNHLTIIFW